MDEVVDRIELQLQAWAHWLTSGGNGAGYPAMSVIHPNWMPPTKGKAPAPKWSASSDAEQRLMHTAIQTLSQRLQATLVVRYCKRLSVAEQAMLLECAESTVGARVAEAKRQLAQRMS